jgi:T-complex protein 1 subunit zeta
VGVNHNSGKPVDPEMEGIYDNYIVKREIINSGYVMKLFS